MEMLGGHGSYFGRAGMERAQVPFPDRGLAGIDCLDDQFVKSVVSGGERRGGQKPRELGNHLFQREDRKSTRLNSSHGYISYAVFCLKKKKRNRSRQSD